MKVKELINELQKCNPDDIVMYDADKSFTIQDIQAMNDYIDTHFGVDDVLIGHGTLRGFVYLSEADDGRV